MFVALRDLRFARGRFLLIGAVVTLITVLVGFLSGLTGGLATQNISGILALPADRLAFTVPSGDDAPSFSTSAPTRDQADTIAAMPGVSRVDPLGISQLRAESATTGTAVAVFGVPADFSVSGPVGDTAGSAALSDGMKTFSGAVGDTAGSAALSDGTNAFSASAEGASANSRSAEGTNTISESALGTNAFSAPSEGTIALSATAAAELDADIGDEVTIAGTSFRVETVGPDAWYSHTPVVEVRIADWRALAEATGSPDAFATVLAVSGAPDWAAVDAEAGVVSETLVGSLTALSAFRSEVGSLLLMVAMLFGISGLVIGAFFTVWTMQRQGDVAVLKALGASTRSLARDALGQALLVLLVGIGTGIGLVAILGALAGQTLPFLISPLTTLVPGAIMIALGLAGAAFALRSVTSADPLTALGGNR
ncbi:ABC transporter permease [Pseudoclavibacter sp. RFBA6]|uniref:ABC transporter permease n=1 Tax=Pseudoclavibacter sp. RFBA6 TaxID=2080573 RepID=UPI000CE8B622|nr:ABC transporter permease [Pseudoclavibacter sp. RFBA6]PPG40507.1 ABC transporter substrate-binding protein [Pseudoclavibacter sp. RFBA6]